MKKLLWKMKKRETSDDSTAQLHPPKFYNTYTLIERM